MKRDLPCSLDGPAKQNSWDQAGPFVVASCPLGAKCQHSTWSIQRHLHPCIDAKHLSLIGVVGAGPYLHFCRLVCGCQMPSLMLAAYASSVCEVPDWCRARQALNGARPLFPTVPDSSAHLSGLARGIGCHWSFCTAAVLWWKWYQALEEARVRLSNFRA